MLRVFENSTPKGFKRGKKEKNQIAGNGEAECKIWSVVLFYNVETC